MFLENKNSVYHIIASFKKIRETELLREKKKTNNITIYNQPSAIWTVICGSFNGR